MTKGNEALTTAFEKQKGGTKAQFQLLKNNAGALAIQLGKMLLPAVNAVLKRLIAFAGWVGELAERYPRLTKGILAGVVAFGSMAAVVSGVSFAVSGLAKGVAFMSTGMRVASVSVSLMSRGFWALNAAVLANPIVAAIAAVVASITFLVIYWERI